ncbi:MAG: hypothetical protein QOJ05_464 [Verrucomicrobiota bacterium]
MAGGWLAGHQDAGGNRAQEVAAPRRRFGAVNLVKCSPGGVGDSAVRTIVIVLVIVLVTEIHSSAEHEHEHEHEHDYEEGVATRAWLHESVLPPPGGG